MNLGEGDVVERYAVEALVGQGGMASVWRVRHRTLGSQHALKLLTVVSVRLRDRLLQEGQIQAQLRHPNLVAVTDVVEVHGQPGLVMEFVDGPSLDTWAAPRHPLDVAEAERMFRGVVAGVAEAHARGLVHRDLKPANVLVAPTASGPIPKVADFGLAKVLAEETQAMGQTRSGMAMGTPPYMSPEQIRDTKHVDARTDVFALGCILYELLAGRRAFPQGDMLSCFTAISRGEYPALDAVRPGLPARLVRAVEGCLEIDRDHRIADCATLVRVLDGDVAAWRAPAERFAARSVTLQEVGPERTMPKPPTAPTMELDLDPTDETAKPAPAKPGFRVPWWGWAIVAIAVGKLVDWKTDQPPPTEVGGAGETPAPTIIAAPAPPIAAAPAPPIKAEAAAPGDPPIESPPPPSKKPPPAKEVVAAGEAPAPVAPVAKGQLKVNSLPWSDLTIDGDPAGRTAFAREVDAGTHVIELVTASGQRAKQTVTVPAGGTANLCWDFDLGAPCR
ncbi:MAG: serine/threonine-protein kinase [Myxococcota bacterium]